MVQDPEVEAVTIQGPTFIHITGAHPTIRMVHTFGNQLRTKVDLLVAGGGSSYSSLLDQF